MKIINKISAYLFTGVLILCLGISEAKAQTPEQVLENIYRTYDSIPFLSFDVTYLYTSDTVNKMHESDMLKGTYTLAGKKAWFVLDNIEYMQNDSFFICVYNDEKFILISEPRSENAGRELPLRVMIDSIMNNYATMYTISQSSTGDTGKLRFESTTVSVDAYNYFEITYDLNDHILYSLTYSYPEEAPQDDAAAEIIVPGIWRKKLTVTFSGYRFDNIASEIYNEGRFVFMENGEYKPVEKYQEYRIFNSKKNAGN